MKAVRVPMPTLRALLETAAGLYRQAEGDGAYASGDLLRDLPEDTLKGPIALERIGQFVYRVKAPDAPEYVLYSRRRAPRPL